MPQIVVVVDQELVGFLLTTSQVVNQRRNAPIVNSMFTAYVGREDASIYRAVCVSKGQRGKGLAQLMFNELLHQCPTVKEFFFVKSDNDASLRVHEKMGINKVSSFVFNYANFEVFAYCFSCKKA